MISGMVMTGIVSIFRVKKPIEDKEGHKEGAGFNLTKI